MTCGEALTRGVAHTSAACSVRGVACGRGCRRPSSRCCRCRGCGHDAAEDVAAQWVGRLELTDCRSTIETLMTGTGEGDRDVAGVRLLARGECAVSTSSLCRPQRPTMTPPPCDRLRRLLRPERSGALRCRRHDPPAQSAL